MSNILYMLLAAAPATTEENPYGVRAALEEGGPIAWATFGLLIGMSVFTFYILFTKMLQQNKIMAQSNKVRASFWNAGSLKEAATKLEKKSAYRAITEDAVLAMEQHGKLTDPVEQHDWLHGSLERSKNAIGNRLGEGLAFLATTGATAPFIGLFGTVVGIYRALIKIGTAGQASISTIAGPVGEALIMTALGLVVAVPAVMAFNWLQRRNKAIMEDLSAFTTDLHGYMMSDGKVKPAMGAPAKTGTNKTATTAPGAAAATRTAPKPAAS